MEISQLNSNQYAIMQNNINVSNSDRLTSVESSNNSTRANIDIVDTNQAVGSEFLSSVSSNVNQIANLQSLQTSTNRQVEIATNLQQLVVDTPSADLDSVQPQVQNLLNEFNSLSSSSSQRLEAIREEQDSEDSRVYFDGILGARPLSQDEILEAVNEQQQRLESFNAQLNEEIIQTQEAAQQSFANERQSVENSRFASVDFELESRDFSAETFKEFTGNVVSTQANAEPFVGEKLLAS